MRSAARFGKRSASSRLPQRKRRARAFHPYRQQHNSVFPYPRHEVLP